MSGTIIKINVTEKDLTDPSDPKIVECDKFKQIFSKKPTPQQSTSLGLKCDTFHLNDCSIVENKLIHLSQIIELNTPLTDFRKKFLFLLFSSYTDGVGATNKNFTILTPKIAKEVFTPGWVSHCFESFKTLLNTNDQHLTAKFTNTPISGVVGYTQIVPELKIVFSVEAFSQLELSKSELVYIDNSEKFKVRVYLLFYFFFYFC
jgi:hypothetical protein